MKQVSVLLFGCLAALAQPQPDQPTRPPAGNDRTLRKLGPTEIAPNLSFYAVDPLYRPGIPLGWASGRIEEKLNRGLAAIPLDANRVYLTWRLLKSDPANVAFNLYRASAGGAPARLNQRPLTKTTDFIDASAPAGAENAWFVRPVVKGAELEASEQVSLRAPRTPSNYRAIKLRDITRGVDRVGIGDLNGDGAYDFVVKHPAGTVDPGRVVPSSATYKIDAYDGKTGEFMWRIDLGWNINHGIWFSPMVVRDLDGDGKAEVCLRTAPYAATRDQAFDGGKGFVLQGPEYLSVYDGATGREIDKVDWIERGQPQEWADHSGNRSSRHMLGVAYLDGKTPSVLVVRGTYGMMRVDAWTLRDRKLHKLWRWTNERAPFKYQGQGQHSIKTADIDGDGADEILNGSIAIDNDGRTMWSTGLGHGDRFYLSDIDPSRPGLEVWYTIEDPHPQNGVSLWDARTGNLIFGANEPTNDNQVAGGLAGDIDPRYPGMEVWGDKFFFTAKGQPISGPVPPQNELVWWDADPLRELLSRGSISKWQGPELAKIQGSTQHVADILGDWREEIVTFTSGELRIYSTAIPATDRRVTLMQDPLYRNDVTHRSMGYPHVPMTSYYLGASPARRP
ncbi:MAG: silent information regulator protein Sir2 [Bryobacteraceae bacterium]|nr:silent information regulator protein Sir2 [Bryobacteraceae bacterium]